MKLNILAIGVHPDDVELSCSGALCVHQKMGWSVGIVDLTRGELGSRGSAELRLKESEHAADILKIHVRENLGFRDGFFENNEEHQRALIRYIRHYQPDIVLANAPKDRHPDHARAAQLVSDACFLSGLKKIETEWNGLAQSAWRPKRLFHYIQDLYLEPDFIIDITEVFEQKMESILAYGTQFNAHPDDENATYISSKEYLNTVRYRNRMMGKKIGVVYGEGFIKSNQQLGLKDFSSVLLPDLV
jgi:Uncharacterized proteins, LmbE homologs